MANTDRYKELKKRIGELRRHLLPEEFSPTGDYTSRVLEIARGYKLLVHAEVESYIEDISKEIVTSALRIWRKKRRTSVTLVAFLSCYHCTWNTDNENTLRELSQNRQKQKEKTDEILKNASGQFIKILDGNHGIREENLRRIIPPTGIEIDDLDTTWLNLVDTFGQQRGEVAHNTKRATSQLNPEDELQNVNDILAGIKKLDQLFRKILKELK